MTKRCIGQHHAGEERTECQGHPPPASVRAAALIGQVKVKAAKISVFLSAPMVTNSRNQQQRPNPRITAIAAIILIMAKPRFSRPSRHPSRLSQQRRAQGRRLNPASAAHQIRYGPYGVGSRPCSDSNVSTTAVEGRESATPRIAASVADIEGVL